MAEEQRGVKVKPKPSLVRLNGSANPVMIGMPGQKLTKLCTFKAPRDLTLGGANAKLPDKKKFVPNLNVVRNIKKEENVDGTSNGHAKQPRKREFGKERKDRKEKPQLIQTTGSVFAEGIGSGGSASRPRSGSGVRSRSGEGGGGGGGAVGGPGVSSEHEEARIRELMRDDFIDDLKSGDRTPVQLPMIDTG